MSDKFVYMLPQEPLVIVYEDDDLLVIEKPAGLLSVSGRLPEHHDNILMLKLPIVWIWQHQVC